MPLMETKNFGTISFEQESELEFPRGLPGFDSRKRFVAVRFVESDPLVYLQSLEDPGLCFITAPVQTVDPKYRLKVSAEDLEQLGLPLAHQPRIGEDVLALTVVAIRETGPTANLLAPVVVNLRNRRAVQAVSEEQGYSHQHVILPEESCMEQPVAEEAPVCS
jgi:flagellar assembly factor FliW